jgi:hypothetical protein
MLQEQAMNNRKNNKKFLPKMSEKLKMSKVNKKSSDSIKISYKL